MVFGEVFGEVAFAFGPVDKEIMALSYTGSDPVKTNVDGFGVVLFDNVIGNSGGTGIVSINMCGSFFEGDV